MEDPCKRSLIGIEAMRTLLLAFCTILGQLAPEELCVPGQLIARRAFHQQERIFAPDPRLCGKVEVKVGEEEWRSFLRQGNGYLDRHMAQSIARDVQRALAEGVAPDAPTMHAMRSERTRFSAF